MMTALEQAQETISELIKLYAESLSYAVDGAEQDGGIFGSSRLLLASNQF
ncbi:MAG: hypothetical protein ACYDHY_15655 [Acidiferrobacterales bacterium]